MTIKNQKTLISDYAVDMLRPTKAKGGVVFLSGGSALATVSKHLSLCKIPAVHLITPFDSGGSSRLLRTSFNLPAVGDIRNRILSLAQTELVGHALPEICSLRFEVDAPEHELRRNLKALFKCEHPIMLRLETKQRAQVSQCLKYFSEQMPDHFSLKGASVGNLLLTGTCLANGRDLYEAVKDFGKFLEVVGQVLPIVDANLHLAARLANGNTVVGQHLITRKDLLFPNSLIDEVYLTPAWPNTDATTRKRRPEIPAHVAELIKKASCICYPMGSFYTSLVANLLPKGVGKAISNAPCYKVYVPSAGIDPETQGLSVADQVDQLLWYLRQDAGEDTPAKDLLTHVYYDSEIEYSGGVDVKRIHALGIKLVDIELIDSNFSSTRFEPYLFLHALADLLAIDG